MVETDGEYSNATVIDQKSEGEEDEANSVPKGSRSPMRRVGG